MKRFYLAETVDLGTLKKFVSAATTEGRILSHRNTPEYAESWRLIFAPNIKEARRLFVEGKGTIFS